MHTYATDSIPTHRLAGAVVSFATTVGTSTSASEEMAHLRLEKGLK